MIFDRRRIWDHEIKVFSSIDFHWCYKVKVFSSIDLHWCYKVKVFSSIDLHWCYKVKVFSSIDLHWCYRALPVYSVSETISCWRHFLTEVWQSLLCPKSKLPSSPIPRTHSVRKNLSLLLFYCSEKSEFLIHVPLESTNMELSFSCNG